MASALEPHRMVLARAISGIIGCLPGQDTSLSFSLLVTGEFDAGGNPAVD